MKKLKIITVLMIVGLFAGCEIEPEEDYYLEPHNTSAGETIIGECTSGVIQRKYVLNGFGHIVLLTKAGQTVDKQVGAEIYNSYTYSVGETVCLY